MSVVILKAEMSDHLFAPEVSERVLKLHQLDKKIVLGVKALRVLGSFEIERQPFLFAFLSRSLREIHNESEVECQWSGKDRIAAKENHLDLHFVAEPAKDVDVVPTLFVIAARRIVVDSHDVGEAVVEA